MMAARRPLEGLRVIELGLALAGPFAGSLLAELGAQVIKIERPGGGDPARLMGISVKDVAVWWGVAARAKLCIDLDLKNDDDRNTLLALIASADALVENYRPGVLERMGLGWTALRELNPRLVMASISGFGQTGPHASRPGFGKIAEAMSGIVMLTGSPDDVPIHIGFSLADTSAGLMGAFGVSLALYQRDVAGQAGAHTDVALFEPLFRMTECQLALAERMGRAPAREGTNDPYGWGASGGLEAAGPTPANGNALRALQCADDGWLMVSAGIADHLAERAGALPVREALSLLGHEGVAAAQVHDGATINADPYFRARGDVREVMDPVIGATQVPGELPKAWRAPELPGFRPTPPDADRATVMALLATRGDASR